MEKKFLVTKETARSNFGLFYLFIIGAVAGLGYLIFKPVASCFDNLQNQNETGVDCGGPCEDCELRDLRLVIGGVDMVGVGGKTSFVVKVENSSRLRELFSKENNKI